MPGTAVTATLCLLINTLMFAPTPQLRYGTENTFFPVLPNYYLTETISKLHAAWHSTCVTGPSLSPNVYAFWRDVSTFLVMDFDSYLLELTASLRYTPKYLHRFLFIYLPVCARRYQLKKGKVMSEQNFSPSFVMIMGRWGMPQEHLQRWRT